MLALPNRLDIAGFTFFRTGLNTLERHQWPIVRSFCSVTQEFWSEARYSLLTVEENDDVPSLSIRDTHSPLEEAAAFVASICFERVGEFVVADKHRAMAVAREVGVVEAYLRAPDDWEWDGTRHGVPYSGTNAPSLEAVWTYANAEVARIKVMSPDEREQHKKQIEAEWPVF